MSKNSSEASRDTVLDRERARECVLDSVCQVGSEQTGIINTFGRTLAESIKSKNESIAQGAVIGPREMALLARLGMPGVVVSRKPRVAIVTTGANVVEIVEQMEPGQVRNAARYEIVGLVLEAGCEVGRLMHVRDGLTGIERAISESLGSEAIIVALGVLDKHEDAVEAVKNLGDVRFAGVTEYASSPMAFGTVEGRPVFIIPSEAVLELFAALIRPALHKMLGRACADQRH